MAKQKKQEVERATEVDAEDIGGGIEIKSESLSKAGVPAKEYVSDSTATEPESKETLENLYKVCMR